MNELLTQSLAQIVTGHHRSAAVFEKYHLDFCCKGKRSLEKACLDQHIPAENVLAELEQLLHEETTRVTSFPFDKLTLTQLSAYITDTHHSYVKKELPSLFAYAQKVASKHGERHPELFGIFEKVADLKEELDRHLEKEEQLLFPRIVEIEQLALHQKSGSHLANGYLQAPIGIMEQEHDHAGALLAEIRQLSDNYTLPADACTTYKLLYASLQAFEADLHQHIHLENNLLFPKSAELLSQLNNAVPGQPR